MTKFGLNSFLERTKGASLRYKLRELWWQLRYAWQRAWRGYDFTDVFELGYNFTAKMPVLLTEFLKNNVGLFYDTEADKQLDEEETNAVIKEMIFYFENCDEDHVYQRLHQNRYYEDGEYDPEKWGVSSCRAGAVPSRSTAPVFQVVFPSLVLTCNTEESEVEVSKNEYVLLDLSGCRDSRQSAAPFSESAEVYPAFEGATAQ